MQFVWKMTVLIFYFYKLTTIVVILDILLFQRKIETNYFNKYKLPMNKAIETYEEFYKKLYTVQI
jgi:hypothetical protein